VSTVPAIAISGRIDSGKSSVADILSESLALPVLSFGAYIRSKSEPHASREQLQDLGAKLLDSLGPSGLVEAVLEFNCLDSSQPAIWEGLRHRTVFAALRRAYLPVGICLIYLHPPEEERLARARDNAGDDARLSSWESHATEQIDDLAQEANLRVVASTPAAAASEILTRLSASDE
jgi:adenylate kinase family enzyme